MENSIYNSAFLFLGNKLKELPDSIIYNAQIHNQWFTPDFIKFAATNWGQALSEKNLTEWLKNITRSKSPKKVAIIMAGNLPFVGLQDLLCVLVTGNIALVKLSSQDEVLMKHVIQILIESNKDFENKIKITERLNDAEALIATGSNNSARYFEYYFRNIPSIIRKNRTSLAVISGNETNEELEELAGDIYQYFGMGCRNVSHLLLPRSIDLQQLYQALDKYMDLVNHHKFYNNYMYHKAILLMNLTKHYDNGFMIFQEKDELHAPLATLNYHYYDSINDIEQYIDKHKDSIQCVVSNMKEFNNVIQLGTSQQPNLWDYADNVNVVEFLLQ
ncbi:MAG: acyl-CoA reductase [Bacteroidetes bacterium]|nr:acyl-CoA reductase [Bacteroidota bacterium]